MNSTATWFAARVRRIMPPGITRYFVISAGVLFVGIAYAILWSGAAQFITGDDLFRIGTPSQLAEGLGGGGIVVALLLVGALWLVLAGFAERGVALRDQAGRIAELEAKLEMQRPE